MDWHEKHFEKAKTVIVIAMYLTLFILAFQFIPSIQITNSLKKTTLSMNIIKVYLCSDQYSTQETTGLLEMSSSLQILPLDVKFSEMAQQVA